MKPLVISLLFRIGTIITLIHIALWALSEMRCCVYCTCRCSNTWVLLWLTTKISSNKDWKGCRIMSLLLVKQRQTMLMETQDELCILVLLLAAFCMVGPTYTCSVFESLLVSTLAGSSGREEVAEKGRSFFAGFSMSHNSCRFTADIWPPTSLAVCIHDAAWER